MTSSAAIRSSPDPVPGRVENGVGDRRRPTEPSDLSDAFDPERVEELVGDLNELDHHVGCIGIDGEKVIT
jgi:hypothetical protein